MIDSSKEELLAAFHFLFFSLLLLCVNLSSFFLLSSSAGGRRKCLWPVGRMPSKPRPPRWLARLSSLQLNRSWQPPLIKFRSILDESWRSGPLVHVEPEKRDSASDGNHWAHTKIIRSDALTNWANKHSLNEFQSQNVTSISKHHQQSGLHYKKKWPNSSAVNKLFIKFLQSWNHELEECEKPLKSWKCGFKFEYTYNNVSINGAT